MATEPADAAERGLAATVELGDGRGESRVDLSAPPGSEDGSLATLLGAVASAPSALPPIELAPGDTLGEVYRIVRKLGAGGMGVVYLARDLELQRDVAVKVHRAAIGTQRLYREAVAMAQLAHPNVATVHGVGRVGGRLYVAMEYVPGQDLSVWLGAAPRSWREVLDMMLAAGEGLLAAHEAGFVHRDIKPHNILVGADGRPRVGDFGLVRVASDPREPAADEPLTDEPAAPASGASASTTPVSSGSGRGASASPLARDLTALGSTLGTPAYMAPEQLAGATVDARADQFAFCVVLYEALYGQRPWTGGAVAELREQIATSGPREPGRTAAPAWLWTAVRRGLAREPAARYPGMRELLAALREPPRRARRLWLAGAGLVTASVVAFALTRGHQPTSCDAAGTPVVAAWGPTISNRIAANYVKLDPDDGPAAARQLATTIDDWARRWQKAAVTSCMARSHARWSPAVRDASERCLHGSLAELRALLARAKDGPTVVDAAALRDPSDCADPVRLVDAPTAPAADIVGHWTGDFGHLVLRRVGDEIWGVYGHDAGTVRGRMTADGFVGWWCEAPSRRPPGDAGAVEMQVIVDKDGARGIAGRWRYGATGDWDDRWDLTWDPSPPPPVLVARLDIAAEFCAPPTAVTTELNPGR